MMGLRLFSHIFLLILGVGSELCLATTGSDYYSRLELQGDPSSISEDEIKKAYRKLAQKLHPDATIGLPEPERKAAEEQLKRINEAYGVLSRKDSRAKYDAGDTARSARKPPSAKSRTPTVEEFLAELRNFQRTRASFLEALEAAELRFNFKADAADPVAVENFLSATRLYFRENAAEFFKQLRGLDETEKFMQMLSRHRGTVAPGGPELAGWLDRVFENLARITTTREFSEVDFHQLLSRLLKYRSILREEGSGEVRWISDLVDARLKFLARANSVKEAERLLNVYNQARARLNSASLRIYLRPLAIERGPASGCLWRLLGWL